MAGDEAGPGCGQGRGWIGVGPGCAAAPEGSHEEVRWSDPARMALWQRGVRQRGLQPDGQWAEKGGGAG